MSFFMAFLISVLVVQSLILRFSMVASISMATSASASSEMRSLKFVL